MCQITEYYSPDEIHSEEQIQLSVGWKVQTKMDESQEDHAALCSERQDIFRRALKASHLKEPSDLQLKID